MADDPATPKPGETPATTVTPATPAAAAAPPAPVVPPENRVPQSVLDRVTGEKWEQTRRAEAAERQLAAAQQTLRELGQIAAGEESERTPATTAGARAEPPGTKRVTPEELARLVQQQSQVNEFNRACNEAVEKGRAAHNDYDRVVLQQLAGLSPVYDPLSNRPVLPQPLVEAALETGEADEVLYELGKNTAEAERIMRLPPIRQAVEIAKFHDKIVAARTPAPGEDEDEDEDEAGSEEADTSVSRAPPPPRKGAGRNGAGARPAFDMFDTSKSSTADWIAKREAELREKRLNGRGRR